MARTIDHQTEEQAAEKAQSILQQEAARYGAPWWKVASTKFADDAGVIAARHAAIRRIGSELGLHRSAIARFFGCDRSTISRVLQRR